MKTYSKCPDEVAKRAASLIKKFHPDLLNTGVKIDLLSVANDVEGEPALMLRGHVCHAVVRIVGVKDRAKGVGDAEIVIDEESYQNMADASKDALLDHELYHLEIVRNKHGMPKKDSQGRPKLKMRLHEIEVGWFSEIAKRHGQASIECQQATRIYLSHKQTLFQFALKVKEGAETKTATVSLV